MQLAVAGVMHQLEIHEIIRTPVFLGNHAMHVQVFAVFQDLVTDGTAALLSPGQLPQASDRGLDSALPLFPAGLEGWVVGRIGGGDESMPDDPRPGELPEGPRPCLLLEAPAVLSTDSPAPILLGSPPTGLSRVMSFHVALRAVVHEAVQLETVKFQGEPSSEATPCVALRA